MKTNKIYLSDNLELLKTISDNYFSSIVTDPPYEISFMGAKWDSSGIAHNVDFWKECLRVLKPGGHLFSFGGTRTYHRMACAVEDAGFQVRDTVDFFHDADEEVKDFIRSLNIDQAETFKRILDQNSATGMLSWVCGAGFPKSMNVGNAIDRLKGAERKTVGFRTHPTLKDKSKVDRQTSNQFHGQNAIKDEWPITEPATTEAKQWDGWKTALKPANEPILMARKPLSEKTVAANVLKWGTGALNIDGCRVPTTEILTGGGGKLWSHYRDNKLEKAAPRVNAGQGRFPANVILDEGAGTLLDQQSGITKSGKMKESKDAYDGDSNTSFLRGKSTTQNQHGDSGGASRFFYCAKASKRERGDGNDHPTVKPLALMQYLVRLITPPGGIVLDPFAGSGTTCIACLEEGFDFVGIDNQEHHIEIANRRLQQYR